MKFNPELERRLKSVEEDREMRTFGQNEWFILVLFGLLVPVGLIILGGYLL